MSIGENSCLTSRYTDLQIRLVQVAGKAWRVTAIQAKPMAYTDDLVHSLGTRLWRTVLPDQGKQATQSMRGPT